MEGDASNELRKIVNKFQVRVTYSISTLSPNFSTNINFRLPTSISWANAGDASRLSFYKCWCGYSGNILGYHDLVLAFTTPAWMGLELWKVKELEAAPLPLRVSKYYLLYLTLTLVLFHPRFFLRESVKNDEDGRVFISFWTVTVDLRPWERFNRQIWHKHKFAKKKMKFFKRPPGYTLNLMRFNKNVMRKDIYSIVCFFRFPRFHSVIPE